MKEISMETDMPKKFKCSKIIKISIANNKELDISYIK